ncbi:MAG: RNA polymerase sigma-24 subunit ecf subfamily [Bacteroidetes bacterium]|nr:MAG: RNA polymerase sigma-24 subunit ecf subfamily [Bacteroidota bacterium]
MNTTIELEMAKNANRSLTSTVNAYGKRLFSFIRSKVGSVEDAEDILQDVWLQFSSLQALEDLESISGWLYRVARNKITDLYRKKKTPLLSDSVYENQDIEPSSFKEILLMDVSGNPELALFKELFWKELFIALDDLPENQKQVFVMNELEDFTLQEIALKTGENIKTIISRKGYAVKHLRNKLSYLYNELDY